MIKSNSIPIGWVIHRLENNNIKECYPHPPRTVGARPGTCLWISKDISGGLWMPYFLHHRNQKHCGPRTPSWWPALGAIPEAPTCSRLLDWSQEPPLAGANLQRGDIHLELCPTLGAETTKPSLGPLACMPWSQSADPKLWWRKVQCFLQCTTLGVQNS